MLGTANKSNKFWKLFPHKSPEISSSFVNIFSCLQILIVVNFNTARGISSDYFTENDLIFPQKDFSCNFVITMNNQF